MTVTCDSPTKHTATFVGVDRRDCKRQAEEAGWVFTDRKYTAGGRGSDPVVHCAEHRPQKTFAVKSSELGDDWSAERRTRW